jgi:predicted PurR-regulated permease PerM
MSNQKKVFLGLLILVTAVTIFLIKSYLGVIALSILVVLMFNPVYKKLLFWSKGSNGLAVWGTLFVILLSLIIPLAIVGTLISSQVNQVASDLSKADFKTSDLGEITNNTLHSINSSLKENSIDYEITIDQVNSTFDEALRSGGNLILDLGANIGARIPEYITQIILFIIFLVFLFPNQERILKTLRKISPLSEEINQIYLSRMAAMARSMVNGTFAVAFVQAVIGAILLWILGVPYILFVSLILLLASMIPLLGSGLVLIPVGIIMLLTGNVAGGIIVLVIQILILANVDNFLRPKLVEEDARMPEAILLLGIIAGIGLFGILGLIFGPVIMIIAYTTYDIYVKYYAISIKNHLNSED